MDLILSNLTTTADNKEILKGISYTFASGQVYAILGPNGSGKSTLAHSVMGSPDYTVSSGSIVLSEKPEGRESPTRTDITALPTYQRAQMGLALSFQSPLPIHGVTVHDILRSTLRGTGDVVALYRQIDEYAKELHIAPELLKRSIHDGFSGGERKKIEVLQLALLNPKIVFFDEIDTGVDVDALSIITRFIAAHFSTTTQVFISHSEKLLDLVHPSTVIIMKSGRIVAEGGSELAAQIHRDGFNDIA